MSVLRQGALSGALLKAYAAEQNQNASAGIAPGMPTAVPFGRWGRVPAARSAILDDIGTGVAEAPLQAFAGLSDAVGNTLIAADDLAGWLNTHVADLRFSTLFGIGGTDAPDKNSPEFREFSEGFKSLPQARSTTGRLIRGTAAWLAGLSVSARALQAMRLGATASTIAGGGISSFFTQAADDPGLANLIQEHPELANPVTEFLASKPGDNAALNRLKHGLEGAGLGALTEGMIRGLLLVQMARVAKGTKEAAGSRSVEPSSVEPGPIDPALAEHGDPDAPLVERQDEPKPPADAILIEDTGAPFYLLHRGRRYTTHATQRRQWKKKLGGSWPLDEKGRHYVLSHDPAIADGAPDYGITFTKLVPHDEHVQQHMKNGDYLRWGRRRGRK
jgi:hypothetical protein